MKKTSIVAGLIGAAAVVTAAPAAADNASSTVSCSPMPLCQINLKEVGLEEKPENLPRLQVRAAMVQLALSQAVPPRLNAYRTKASRSNWSRSLNRADSLPIAKQSALSD